MGNVNDTQELQALLADLQVLLLKYNKVTRDFYRTNGAFNERIWNKYFPTFKDFKEAASGIKPDDTTEEKHTFSDDTWDLSIPKTSIHTLEELLEYCKVDLGIWAVERFTVNKWDGATKNGPEPFYQVKATLVKRKALVAARAEIEDLKKLAKESAHWPEITFDKTEYFKTGNCLELLIPDLHAGKFAWGKETGGADYDTPTAIATYEAAVQNLLTLSNGFVFDEIVLGVGNDLLNSDDYNSQTTKGTLVNSDTRYQKTYKAVREMLVRTIEKLRQHCIKVVVKVIPGNHDTQTCFTMGDSLECYFHNYPDVEIDNSPTPHKFYRWGNVFLGFTHGDKGKKADYGLWMATERPQDFGETKFREIHIGHTHGLKVDEKFGVRVRTFAALCPPDAWHSAEHFVGNLRQAEAIVWNKDRGRIAEFIHTEID
jgi:hypothetical protein